MRQRVLPGIVLAIAGMAAIQVQAQDCGLWGTAEFYETASPADVERCLAKEGRSVDDRSGFFGYTPLHFAAEYNSNPEVVGLLLERGADLEARDRDGRTPLHFAARRGRNPAVVGLLLDRGADLEARDMVGRTPLHWAAESDPEVVGLLLERGANLEARTGYGWTPLHEAMRWSSNPEVVALLLDRGADLEVRGGVWGSTPLHEAARWNSNPEVVGLLLERGADHEARTVDGKTPWDLVQENDDLKGSKAYWRLNDLRYD